MKPFIPPTKAVYMARRWNMTRTRMCPVALTVTEFIVYAGRVIHPSAGTALSSAANVMATKSLWKNTKFRRLFSTAISMISTGARLISFAKKVDYPATRPSASIATAFTTSGLWMIRFPLYILTTCKRPASNATRKPPFAFPKHGSATTPPPGKVHQSSSALTSPINS
jgi:hypothetical protein